MPYDPTLQSDSDKVRLKIGDVYDQEFLADSEINFYLDESGGNIIAAAAKCCRAIAARVARNTDYRFSTLWDNASQAFEHFTKMAEHLEDEIAQDSAPKRAGVLHKKREAIFDIGMHDYDGPVR